MNRRQLLAASAFALLTPGASVLAGGVPHTAYSRAVYEDALTSGKPFLLDFFASW